MACYPEIFTHTGGCFFRDKEQMNRIISAQCENPQTFLTVYVKRRTDGTDRVYTALISAVANRLLTL